MFTSNEYQSLPTGLAVSHCGLLHRSSCWSWKSLLKAHWHIDSICIEAIMIFSLLHSDPNLKGLLCICYMVHYHFQSVLKECSTTSKTLASLHFGWPLVLQTCILFCAPLCVFVLVTEHSPKNTNSNYLRCKMSDKLISKSIYNPPYPLRQ